MLRKVIAANHIENDIDTLTGPFLRTGKPVILAVVKSPLCAQRNAELALPCRASRGDDARAKIPLARRVAEIMQERGVDNKAALKQVARERGLTRREAYKQLLITRDE